MKMILLLTNLEIPGYEGGGNITPGTALVQAPRREGPESLNQLWAENYQCLMPYDPKVRLWAKGGEFENGVPVVVENYILGEATFEWMFEIP
ncbi:unnamed protein product [Cunninghamella echinulata]